MNDEKHHNDSSARNEHLSFESKMQELDRQKTALSETIENLREERKAIDNDKFTMAEANLSLLEKNELIEEQKIKLANANLALLEKNEIIEAQRYQLVEANNELIEKNEIIENERRKSEELLLNVLPAEVARDLKETGRTEPKLFRDVTLFFSDFVGFTKASSNMPAKTLIAELSDMFTVFDEIAQNNDCERIKTIGDAYLCVSGLPVPDEAHASNIIRAALDMVEYLRNRNKTAEHQWQMRVGIHSGEVVGAVVGVSKYIYDIFGDTVNIASRMESHSEPMRINVSEATRALAADSFTFEDRGLVEVAGKGQQRMFFLS